jgi:RNA polymerase sigma factor (sigma-70 family)
MSTAFNAEKTIILLARAKNGDGAARDELYRRIIPRLERFAHGRLPLSLRRFADTQDIVQDAVARSLEKVECFEAVHEGAFMAYLSTIVLNRIRDLARRRDRGREQRLEDSSAAGASRDPSPVEEAVGAETFQRYQKSLASLNEDQRLAVLLHVEMGYSPAELAEAMDRGAEAARKVLSRALKNLAAKMQERP